MRRRNLLAMVPAAAVPAAANEWTNAFARGWRDSFRRHWEVTRDYTLAVCDAMPADGFGFKPVPEQRTFAEQLTHLALANVAYMTAFNRKQPPERRSPLEKAEVRKYLEETFDYVTDVLNLITEQDLGRSDFKFSTRVKPHNGTDLFLRAYMHTAHHRGQVIAYLRLKGIVPPAWAFEPTTQ